MLHWKICPEKAAFLNLVILKVGYWQIYHDVYIFRDPRIDEIYHDFYFSNDSSTKMLIAFTEPSSGQRIEENESRNVDWSFRREASNLCPCHLPIGQLRNIVSLLKNKILKKYMKRCDV